MVLNDLQWVEDPLSKYGTFTDLSYGKSQQCWIFSGFKVEKTSSYFHPKDGFVKHFDLQYLEGQKRVIFIQGSEFLTFIPKMGL